MKKGCFLTSLLTLTIVLGVAFYLVKNHKVTINKLVKPWVIGKVKDKFDNKIASIKNTPERDTLISIVNAYAKSIKEAKDYDIDKDSALLDEIQFAMRDSVIDPAEISKIKVLFNKHMTLLYARQKKNSD
jgi:hypothetical protein